MAVLGLSLPARETVVKFWVCCFLLASIPSCMPVYTNVHRLLLSGVSLSRFALRTMASSISAETPAFSVSYVTAPNDTIAKFIARGLIERKLAACVNIVPGITSIYTWKNEIQEDTEVLMIIKSKVALLENLTTYVRENHPYDVCEVISTPIIQGNPPYLQWLRDSTASELDQLTGGTTVSSKKQ